MDIKERSTGQELYFCYERSYLLEFTGIEKLTCGLMQRNKEDICMNIKENTATQKLYSLHYKSDCLVTCSDLQVLRNQVSDLRQRNEEEICIDIRGNKTSYELFICHYNRDDFLTSSDLQILGNKVRVIE